MKTNKIEMESYLQWLTTHSLLQYSSSHSGFVMAGFGQPWRMQEVLCPDPICPWAWWWAAACCCWWAATCAAMFCCCATDVGMAGDGAETGGELDTIGWGLMCCMWGETGWCCCGECGTCCCWGDTGMCWDGCDWNEKLKS